jgi:phosphate-selective porin OprO/OprP
VKLHPLASLAALAAAPLLAAPPAAAQDEGWSLDIIGRLQLDYTTAEADLAGVAESWSDSEIRRARLGVEGEQGRVSFRTEVTFDDSDVILEDAWIELDAGAVTLIAGHWRSPVSFTQQTSSRHGTSLERPAFAEAFGFGRRLGVGVSAAGERYTV